MFANLTSDLSLSSAVRRHSHMPIVSGGAELPHKTKIISLDELTSILERYRTRNKKIVHCHGVFDLLHIGHIRHFNQARQMGEVLVVTLTPDRFVDKGPDRPAFSENLRAEAIASLNMVDYVAINKWPTAEETLRLIRPDFYVKGSEFADTSSDVTGKIGREEQVAKEIGAKLAFTEDIVFSSSNLINRYLSTLPEEMAKYLSLFRKRHQIDEVHNILDQMSGLKVLVIGDTILDDYHYCQVIGKSSKDPVLALQYQHNDLFAGGVLAVANHAANFAGEVQLVTVLGEQKRQEQFIRERLAPNVSAHYVTKPGAPTIVKRRFIEGYSFNKLFEVYVMDGSGLPEDRDIALCNWLEERLSGFDAVIAADFGHGAISDRVARTLEKHARFLSINTQANAGNRGFHTVTRYRRADFVCLAEHEIRLEMRDLTGSVFSMIDVLADKLSCRQFVLTRGKKGILVKEKGSGILEVPAFALRVVDRVGAGDAVFAVGSLAAAQQVPPEIIGFIGNAVGCLAVETVGNLKPVDKLSLKKYISSFMK